MAIKINNPIPRSLKSESKKAARILASFIKPNQIMGADQVIPPSVLQEAKGLAIITVLKAGFLFSGRAGSGIIVSRLPDGSWSAPSAIMTAGAGVGGQIGAELTDFVFILNTKAAVESFAQMGSITLGGNVSLAAGPLGRNAEAAGTASLKSAAAIFSYSKTKGLFAGVSLEGSVIVERRDANRKFYGGNCTAKTILSGRVDPPPACDPLFRVLDSRAFTKKSFNHGDEYDDYYNDIPTSFSDDDEDGDSSYDSRHRNKSPASRRNRSNIYDDEDSYRDDYDPSSRPRSSTRSLRRQESNGSWEDDVYDTSRSGPGRPSSSKPNFSDNAADDNKLVDDDDPFINSKSGTKAVALYSFDAEQEGDLPFKKGDVITILKKSDSIDDWWSGECHGKEGIFPANYIELI
ncbi:Lsb3 protein [Saccharomycopsis crataegensis]|uniref:Lsb3 protein n=1 Tax=Saccharomycopsis crataegensis TaxID=43959 RepID=A0AAV5QGL8_9ASCO|nr:Lsb3 protein [Saccharomycopsis crataegensis]